MSEELDALAVFVAVVEAKGFRAAGERLGVSGSAVSQTMQRLEARVGAVLLQRTTRSVRLTEAGERVYAAARPALEELRAALAAAGELGGAPRGTLRLLVAPAAEGFLSGELLAGFLAAHPHVRLDLFVSDEAADIVAAGYDAGIRLGEVIDRDMVAVPVSGDLRLVVVGSPAYFARHPAPTHPRDLAEHDCINWHPTPDAPPYQWEFTEPAADQSLHDAQHGGPRGGRDFAVAVPTRVLTNDPALNVRLARAGVGLTLADGRWQDDVARGELVPVLEAFSTPFPGFYLYYPQRRHASPGLRALVDHLRRARQAAPPRPTPPTARRATAAEATPPRRAAAKRR